MVTGASLHSFAHFGMPARILPAAGLLHTGDAAVIPLSLKAAPPPSLAGDSTRRLPRWACAATRASTLADVIVEEVIATAAAVLPMLLPFARPHRPLSRLESATMPDAQRARCQTRAATLTTRRALSAKVFHNYHMIHQDLWQRCLSCQRSWQRARSELTRAQSFPLQASPLED